LIAELEGILKEIIADEKQGQKREFTAENLYKMWSTIHLAEEMAEGLGSGEILFRQMSEE
jgi:hypothetical protein